MFFAFSPFRSWSRLGQFWEPLGASWEPLGGFLGASWGLLGPSWGALGALLGVFGALLGPSWRRSIKEAGVARRGIVAMYVQPHAVRNNLQYFVFQPYPSPLTWTGRFATRWDAQDGPRRRQERKNEKTQNIDFP